MEVPFKIGEIIDGTHKLSITDISTFCKKRLDQFKVETATVENWTCVVCSYFPTEIEACTCLKVQNVETITRVKAP
jgi:hypothetical protein